MKTDKILNDAMSTPSKLTLDLHKEAVLLLRGKGYTWREIAAFLVERGIQTDHTKVFRFFKKIESRTEAMQIPNSSAYRDALTQLQITDNQKLMLGAHFHSHNRTITYTELAEAAGFETFGAANIQYGKLGGSLGEALGFNFLDSDVRPGEKFLSSSIGMPNPYSTGDFQLIMHHELAKALADLGWFPA